MKTRFYLVAPVGTLGNLFKYTNMSYYEELSATTKERCHVIGIFLDIGDGPVFTKKEDEAEFLRLQVLGRCDPALTDRITISINSSMLSEYLNSDLIDSTTSRLGRTFSKITESDGPTVILRNPMIAGTPCDDPFEKQISTLGDIPIYLSAPHLRTLSAPFTITCEVSVYWDRDSILYGVDGAKEHVALVPFKADVPTQHVSIPITYNPAKEADTQADNPNSYHKVVSLSLYGLTKGHCVQQ